MSNQKFISFEQGWETLQNGIKKLLNILEGLEPNFTPQERINLYTTVYELCIQKPFRSRDYSRELYDKYRETCEEYIVSKVLPFLQEKKGEFLLRELLKRWSNYKVMTGRLSYIFNYLDQADTRRYKLPSLEITNFLSFNNGIDRKLAGEMIDHTLVINTLDFYIKFYRCTEKDMAEGGKRKCRSSDISKKINLRSSDGAVFEIDYNVALMSKRFEDITEMISVGDEVDTISVHKVNSKMLTIIVEYCKKHRNYYELYGNCPELLDGDAKLVEVDPKTLLDLTTSACYMKIESLEKLTWSKIDELIKGKTPKQITQIFGGDSNSMLIEQNVQVIDRVFGDVDV